MNKIKQFIKTIKKQIKILYFAFNDKELSKFVKFFIFFILAYALSPIDLIPDFIPILGYLDDAILLPILIYIALKFINSDILSRAKIKESENEDLKLPISKVGAFLIICVWVLIIVLLVIKLV